MRDHVAGYDHTLSPTNSVSTIGWTGRHAGVARIRDGEHINRVRMGRVALAQFLHVTARETETGIPEPHLDTHHAILNMTQDDAGNWRSLDARDLYALQKDAGAI